MKKFLKFGCLGILGLFIVVVGIGFFASENENQKTLNVFTDDVFKEKLDLNSDFEDGSYTVKYKDLAKKLNGLYTIQTVDFNFMFKKGLTELSVIPMKDTIPFSSGRNIYNLKKYNVIPRHLNFLIDGTYKGILDLQFDSGFDGDNVLVVKFLIGDSVYVKRGVVKNIN